jgi:two-component system phosphate regulon sensor histidine kinase PhoR
LPNHWTNEVWRLASILVVALIPGIAIGYPYAAVAIALLGYLFWHFRKLRNLYLWLRAPDDAPVPDAEGLWGEVFHALHTRQQRIAKREQKLSTLLTRFEDASMALPDAVVVLRGEGTIDWINPAAERLLGLRPQQDMGQSVTNLVRNPVFVSYLRSHDYTAPILMESPRNANLTLNIRIVPYGHGLRLLVARDITRMQRLEQMRRDFVANISHELRTPLTVVTGYLETMIDSAEPALEPWLGSLRLMQEQTRRMSHLVTDLLFLSRIETSPRTSTWDPVSVPALLAAIREEALALSGEERHTIDLEVDESLWIKGNESELRSAFSNIVFNAVRYTPAQGHITVRWYGDERGAHLEVQDSGIGIAAEHIPRLTERFYRVDTARSRERGGTGLGLAIVKHVMARHEGELTIESTPGVGSKFACHFQNQLVIRQQRRAG